MMYRWLISCMAVFGILSLVGAQATETERSQKSADVIAKANQVDLMNQILPILMTKEQYKALLGPIERSRQRVRETEKLEAAELQKLEPKLDAALKDANEKGLVPSRELLSDVSKALTKMGMARRIISDMNTSEVMEAFNKVANGGQKKAAMNALNPRYFDPTAKVEEMKDEDRLKVFVREILLHPTAYELMRKLSM